MADEPKKPLTYADAGVDVQKGEEVARNITSALQATWNDHIVANVSGFKAVYDMGDHYIIGATDGVGTKLLVAIMAEKFGTVGQDLVAMCVNDIARVGGEPLFFLDYMATGRLQKEAHREIVGGIAEACRMGGFPLMGGETAEMPGMYGDGHFDLAGFAVGRVHKDDILDGSQIRPGATLVGIESNGIHSNGYSLARRVFFEVLRLGVNDQVPEFGETVGDALLRPTIIYTRPIAALLETFPGQIQGMAHITGGGMPNKLPKALPEGLGAVVESGNWPVHAIFDYIAKNGPVELDEMRRTFNMGIGMVAAVNDKGVVPDMVAMLQEEHNLKAYEIGRVVEGSEVQYTA